MDFIPVSTPSLTSEDADAVAQAIRDGWISAEGPQVKDFEAKFSQTVGVEHGIAVANGTAALDIAFEALGIGKGDEVILPSFTIISCLSHVLRSGATPVFVDALESTWNMDPQQVKDAISPRTKAIVVVHIYGLPADIDEILVLANEHGIPVIEDSAEAHGQHLDGKPLGSWGTISTFSFYSNKLITTGEGGMILTNDETLAEKCRTLRNLSFNPERRFVHESLGWNYRLTAMQAALGLSQLARIDSLLEHKKSVGRHYQDLFSDLEGVALPLASHRGSENVYWVFGLVLDAGFHHDAREIMTMLQARGIGTRPFFYPLHQQPVLAGYGFQQQRLLPVAEWLGRQGFYLPNGADLTPAQREYVAAQVKEVLQK